MAFEVGLLAGGTLDTSLSEEVNLIAIAEAAGGTLVMTFAEEVCLSAGPR